MGYYEQKLRRKQEIEDCLLDLMGKLPYDQINVKDITQKLNISRKTFYQYFPNKLSCLESLTDRMFWECNLQIMHLHPDAEGLPRIYEAHLLFWIQNRGFLEAMIRSKLSTFFVSQALQYLNKEVEHLREKLETPQVKYDEDILFFYISGQIYLMLKWCNEGFTLPVEEMTRKLVRLIHEPLISVEQ